MKWTHVWMAVLAAGALILVSSCSKDYTGKENSHPLFAKGVSLKASGQYVKACEAFEGFLALCPKSARTHKELAELYGDYRSDFIKSIFHYEKYLELGKLSDTDRKDVRKLIEKNKQKFYEKYQVENGLVPLDSASASFSAASPAVQELETSLAAARQTERAIAEKYKVLYYEKKALAEELQKLKARNASASAIPPVRVASSSQATAASGSAAAHGGTSYTVQKGETLSSIAVKIYGKKSAWKDIRDANAGKIPENGAVRAGQVILLPKL